MVGTRNETPRRVSLLGATGSVGQSTLDLIARQPDAFDVIALTAHRDVAGLAAAARQFSPEVVAIADAACYGELSAALAGSGVRVLAGPEGVVEAAATPADWVMAAIVGAAGLAPTLAAVRQGATVALANKECLVCAGTIMIDAVAAHGATLLPVDSEHNAIFQVFDQTQPDAVERLILTASGGPFRTASLAEMAAKTPAQAVAHPNWSMGAKISVDSATMMNKGLEIIEAHHLFNMPEARIDVVVHPESVIHSMVAYVDGSVLAQMGTPDMRTPIAHTLAWPARMAAPSPRLDLVAVGQLRFEAPDPLRFPCLELARAALRDGQAATVALNAANEVAVAAFLAERIGFCDIAEVGAAVLAEVKGWNCASVDHILEIDGWARGRAEAVAAARPVRRTVTSAAD
ncbi:MAG: 1-deoxy-D-xylulose-5-phosphate reductoisomerase [Pseudomonadota bacterium]|nr:1-deoxy-D-xylulose-5-phosphate reductoisomerase [Pseudomonadota bacterium]